MAAHDPTVRRHAARVSVLKRHRDPDDPAIASAERDLRAARLARLIRAAVDAAPPLTGEQRTSLASLLAPVGGACE